MIHKSLGLTVLIALSLLVACRGGDRSGGGQTTTPAQSTPQVTAPAPLATPAGPDSCLYALDGQCDHPGGGTGVCAAGTDTTDCAVQATPAATPAGPDSCQYAFDGECDETGIGTGACAAGTDRTDCSAPPPSQTCSPDSMQCPDGAWVGRTGPNCEHVCPAPTPTGGADSCQYAFDGECDEPGIGTGACASGTDATDCRLPSTPASTSSNSCQYAFDGECDDPAFGGTGACAVGTDAADCS